MREVKREKIWEIAYRSGDAAKDASIKEISDSLGVSELFAILLYNRGYTDSASAKRFLEFEETDFYDPYLLKDMDMAVERILAAVENGEKIYVYGDYDVDGATSTSMLYLYLVSLGAEVGIKIPKRDGEGYGVSSAAIRAIAADGASLIITVDTGITANEEVEYARGLGVDFVITDHHECHGEIPGACAVVNPHRPDCSYPFKALAGVGVVFKTVCACEMELCRRAGKDAFESVRRVCTEYADLVAVGTIADVMPLVDENRLIVSLGLSMLERGIARPGLMALLDASTKKSGDDAPRRKVTSGMVGFGIAPRLNAAGRIGDAIMAVKLLLSTDAGGAEIYAEQLCEINRQRQIEENKIATEAYEMIENTDKFDGDRVLVLENNNWQQGIIGIVSSRITERYGLPSILISFNGLMGDEESPYDDGKGSGRSIKGLNLVEALGACQDLLVKYGGHELAAGLSVKRGNIDDFRRRINDYAKQIMTEDMFIVRVVADCELRAQDISLAFANEILMLEPFGNGNISPQFAMRKVNVRRVTHMGGGKHTRLTVEKDGLCFTALYFGVGEGELSVEEGDVADILFSVDINEFRGSKSVQLILQDIAQSKEHVERLAYEKERYEQIRHGGGYSSSENVLPTREDCAAVYTALRREFRSGCSVLDIKSILRVSNANAAEPINYIKLKLIIRILDELKICQISEISDDIYSFKIEFRASKTSIEKSSILKMIRNQCTDRGCAQKGEV